MGIKVIILKLIVDTSTAYCYDWLINDFYLGLVPVQKYLQLSPP
jgi:hypothetical protein